MVLVPCILFFMCIVMLSAVVVMSAGRPVGGLPAGKANNTSMQSGSMAQGDFLGSYVSIE